MKSIAALVLITFGCLGSSAITLAARVCWNPENRPNIQLAEASEIARQKLNAEEGLPLDSDKYYCLSAGLAITTYKGGDWTFHFASEDGAQRWVIMSFDKEAQVLMETPEH